MDALGEGEAGFGGVDVVEAEDVVVAVVADMEGIAVVGGMANPAGAFKDFPAFLVSDATSEAATFTGAGGVAAGAPDGGEFGDGELAGENLTFGTEAMDGDAEHAVVRGAEDDDILDEFGEFGFEGLAGGAGPHSEVPFGADGRGGGEFIFGFVFEVEFGEEKGGSGGDEPFDEVEVSEVIGDLGGGLALGVDGVEVDVGGEEGGGDGEAAFFCGEVKWGFAIGIGDAEVGFAGDKPFDDGELGGLDGEGEGGIAAVVGPGPVFAFEVEAFEFGNVSSVDGLGEGWPGRFGGGDRGGLAGSEVAGGDEGKEK